LKAFVLAAGRGERLKPLTDQTPKPLLKIQGQSLLDFNLAALGRMGVKRVVINAHHLRDQIRDFVEEARTRYSFEILLSEEEQLLGTAGGLKKALPLLGEPPFLILNADNLWVGDLMAFVQKSESLKPSASWLLSSLHPDQTQIGVHQQKVVQIGNLFQSAEPEEFFCFSGIQYMKAVDAEILPEKGCLVRDYFIPQLKRTEALGGLSGFLKFWEDIGTPERLQRVNQMDKQKLSLLLS